VEFEAYLGIYRNKTSYHKMSNSSYTM